MRKKYIRILTFLLILFIIMISVLSLIHYFFYQPTNLAISPSQNFEIVSISDTETSQKDRERFCKVPYPFFVDVNYFLTIPSIQLYRAPIKEGTSQGVMKKYIGHFNHTSFLKGNIGLASHNRGSGANYFSNLKNIKKGDVIFYQNHGEFFLYEVDLIQIIDECDWSFLQNTKEDKMTLITCVENKENLRLCVQARKR